MERVVVAFRITAICKTQPICLPLSIYSAAIHLLLHVHVSIEYFPRYFSRYMKINGAFLFPPHLHPTPLLLESASVTFALLKIEIFQIHTYVYVLHITSRILDIKLKKKILFDVYIGFWFCFDRLSFHSWLTIVKKLDNEFLNRLTNGKCEN